MEDLLDYFWYERYTFKIFEFWMNYIFQILRRKYSPINIHSETWVASFFIIGIDNFEIFIIYSPTNGENEYISNIRLFPQILSFWCININALAIYTHVS